MSFSLVCNKNKLNDELIKSFSILPIDPYVKIKMLRYRTYSYAEVLNGCVRWTESLPFFQKSVTNSAAGGLHRQYSGVGIAGRNFATEIVKDIIERNLVASNKFYIGCHQIRVISNLEVVGYPAPEGFHYDETDFLTINLINESNVNGATTLISEFDDTSRLLFDKKLKPGQSLYIQDSQHKHYVSPFTPKIPATDAFRDIIGVAFYWEDIRS